MLSSTGASRRSQGSRPISLQFPDQAEALAFREPGAGGYSLGCRGAGRPHKRPIPAAEPYGQLPLQERRTAESKPAVPGKEALPAFKQTSIPSDGKEEEEAVDQ